MSLALHAFIGSSASELQADLRREVKEGKSFSKYSLQFKSLVSTSVITDSKPSFALFLLFGLQRWEGTYFFHTTLRKCLINDRFNLTLCFGGKIKAARSR